VTDMKAVKDGMPPEFLLDMCEFDQPRWKPRTSDNGCIFKVLFLCVSCDSKGTKIVKS